VVTALDPQTLALPDWHGNNRIDSLRYIVRDGRVSLIFLIPGSNNALRVNGTARLTADPDLRSQRDLDDIAKLLNDSPRKTLDWRTPAEAFAEEVAKSVAVGT
jgi:hypothetical protein